MAVMDNMLDTPVLLITFIRPDHTRRALNAIREQKPKRLYVGQDGPREGRQDDVAKLQAVRAVVDELVDWDCELHTLYQEKNLGCGRGPYEAMSWFFQNEEKGIVLEDDINPHPLFFPYMEDLLERYMNDNAVGMVTAHNLQRYYSSKNSYYFTYEMAGTLGWGTWRRVWEKFDFDIPFDPEVLGGSLKKYGMPRLCRKMTVNNYKKWLSRDRHDCWDYQFDYYLLVNHYLNARANSCLTSHEGDDGDATHSEYSNPGYSMEVNVPLFETISHPDKVKVDSSVKWRMWKREAHCVINKLMKHD